MTRGIATRLKVKRLIQVASFYMIFVNYINFFAEFYVDLILFHKYYVLWIVS